MSSEYGWPIAVALRSPAAAAAGVPSRGEPQRDRVREALHGLRSGMRRAGRAARRCRRSSPHRGRTASRRAAAGRPVSVASMTWRNRWRMNDPSSRPTDVTDATRSPDISTATALRRVWTVRRPAATAARACRRGRPRRRSGSKASRVTQQPPGFRRRLPGHGRVALAIAAPDPVRAIRNTTASRRRTRCARARRAPRSPGP